MKAITAWLRRLGSANPDLLDCSYFRVVVSGTEPLDVTDCLLSIDPQGPLPNGPHASVPESWSLLRLLDVKADEVSLHARHRLGAELACALSLSMGRRVATANDIAIAIPQTSNLQFLPATQVVDQSILGPLPRDAKDQINRHLLSVSGLPPDDQETIGAASSAYHSALLLFDKEPRIAYTLLVAGVETLSRRYGAPPTDWESWEQSNAWEQFFEKENFTTGQRIALQTRLMQDKQLRLSATFRSYGATRPNDSFWQRPLDHWIYGVDGHTGDWLPATKTKSRVVGDVLPRDRAVLSKALTRSYIVRSKVVHEAEWIELMTMAGEPNHQEEGDRALPFPVLRALLEELIQLELATHATPATLPDIQLRRSQPR